MNRCPSVFSCSSNIGLVNSSFQVSEKHRIVIWEPPRLVVLINVHSDKQIESLWYTWSCHDLQLRKVSEVVHRSCLIKSRAEPVSSDAEDEGRQNLVPALFCLGDWLIRISQFEFTLVYFLPYLR